MKCASNEEVDIILRMYFNSLPLSTFSEALGSPKTHIESAIINCRGQRLLFMVIFGNGNFEVIHVGILT